MQAKIAFNPFILFFSVFLLAGSLRAQDVPGSKDPDGINRMSGFKIEQYEVTEKGVYLMDISPTESQNMEGLKTYIEYRLKKGATRPNKTDIFKWYFKQAESIGGTVPFEDLNDNMATLAYTRDGKVVFCAVNIWDDGAVIALTVMEP